MHIVTVATKNEGYFDYLVESCKRNGGKLEVLGWGQEWKGFSMKINLMRKYLDSIEDNEIVCFVDGYDVIILQPTEKLEKLFRSSGKRIIFSRDIDSSYIPFLPTLLTLYFGKCNNYTINSGTYIGYVKDLKALFKQIYEKYGTDDKNDDQQIMNDVCNYNKNIAIDENRQLFLVTNNLDSNFDKIKIENKKLRLDKHFPCILHTPGNFNLKNILDKLGYDTSNIKRRSAYEHFIKGAFTPMILKILIFCSIIFLLYTLHKLKIKVS